MHLIDDEVCGRLQYRPQVVCPSFGIGLCHVDDRPPSPVGTHGLGEDTGTLTPSHVEGIEPMFQVTVHRRCPGVLCRACHLHRLGAFPLHTIVIESQFYLLGIVRGKEFECGGLRGVGHLVKHLSRCLCAHDREHGTEKNIGRSHVIRQILG